MGHKNLAVLKGFFKSELLFGPEYSGHNMEMAVLMAGQKEGFHCNFN